MNNTELLKGTLSTLILHFLSEHKRLYGYEITQMVKERSQNKILLKEGSLYPALHKLEAEGLVISEEVFIGKRVRRYYKLTNSGKKATRTYLNELSAFLKTIENLILPFPKIYEPSTGT
jgi:PadR family transcriptional regulator PadR